MGQKGNLVLWLLLIVHHSLHHPLHYKFGHLIDWCLRSWKQASFYPYVNILNLDRLSGDNFM